jgi:Class II Aldolase and Adducin N-terminal domain
VSKYVKFTYDRAGAEIARFDQLVELNAYRRKLLEQRLMGVDSNGVGFGNVSVRDGVSENFCVTGSATGGLPELTPTDCLRVVAYDFARNWLRYEGAAIPSSESLTHAAIYESSNDLCGHSLSRLGFVGNAPRSRNFEVRCLRHAGNGV